MKQRLALTLLALALLGTGQLLSPAIASDAASPLVELVYVPAFPPAPVPEDDADQPPPDPLRRPLVSQGFYAMTHEVTQAQFEAVLGWRPVEGLNGHFCHTPPGAQLAGPDLPIVCVSWHEAVEFANALSRREGLLPAYVVQEDGTFWDRSANGYRLPTEAEWEHMARGPSLMPILTAGALCGYGNVWDVSAARELAPWSSEQAAACDDSSAALAPVKSYKPNGFGLYDTLGNAAEWCWDPYGMRHTPGEQANDAGSLRVVRGSSWVSHPPDAGIKVRALRDPGRGHISTGFRLVRSGWGSGEVVE